MPGMKKTNVMIVKDKVENEFLPFVRKPARYIGGEINQIQKNLNEIEIKVALCFPDTYEIGMSNTGVSIVYDVINSLEWACAERVFTPWVDAEEVMREKEVPLYTLESMAAVKCFDVFAFSVTTELCHTNILLSLDLAGVPLHSSERGEESPIVIGGGQISNCCEPIAEFIDVFMLGEGEEAIVELLEVLREHKQKGSSREETLLDIAKSFDWAYVPRFYELEYDGEEIVGLKPLVEGLRTRFENAVVHDLDGAAFPDKPIVPFAEAIHERISIEVMRGCPGRCRCCQASFCRRPIRYRSVKKIVEIAKKNYEATAFDTVSLLSLSTADYPWLDELIDELNEFFAPKKVGISLPSLRVDKQLELVPKMATSVRKGGLTIAVEAASEKLRRMINKGVTNENLFKAVEAAYKVGFQRVKLYFMAGFPGETEDDIRQIVDLAYEVARLRRNVSNRNAQVSAAVSWLIPKPHTPMGWFGQCSREYFERAKEIIIERKKELGIRCVNFKFHELERSVLEAVVGRGDRRISRVIEDAYVAGARFDLWNETFDYELWKRSFEKFGYDVEVLAQKSYREDEVLPWDHLGGPEKDYLLKHYHKAMAELDQQL